MKPEQPPRAHDDDLTWAEIVANTPDHPEYWHGPDIWLHEESNIWCTFYCTKYQGEYYAWSDDYDGFIPDDENPVFTSLYKVSPQEDGVLMWEAFGKLENFRDPVEAQRVADEVNRWSNLLFPALVMEDIL